MLTYSFDDWRERIKVGDKLDVNLPGHMHSLRGIVIEVSGIQIKSKFYGWSGEHNECRIYNKYDTRISPPNTYLMPFIPLPTPYRLSLTKTPLYWLDNDTNCQYFFVPSNCGSLIHNITTNEFYENDYGTKLAKELESLYHIFNKYDNTIYFIDVWGEKVITMNLDKGQYHCSRNMSLKALNKSINNRYKKNCKLLIIENEIHILRMIGSRNRRIEHIKYVKKCDKFIQINCITSKYPMEWEICRFIYSSSQKRLYMVSLQNMVSLQHGHYHYSHQYKFNIAFIDFRCSFYLKWIEKRITVKFKNNRKLNIIRTNYNCLLVYDTILLIENYGTMFWIDLRDNMMIYRHFKWIPGVEKENSYLLNTYDDDVHFIRYHGRNRYWFKLYLLDIIPNKMYLKYKNNAFTDLINGYFKEMQNNENLFCHFPSYLVDLVIDYFPIFHYF